MCRRQPGPRCPKHSKQRLQTKIARLERLETRLSKVHPETKGHARLLAEIRDLKDQIIMDENDFNSSPSRWKELAAFLEEAAARGEHDTPAFKKAARDLATGKMLWAERRRQNKMMPRIDRSKASAAACAAWDDLGNARAEMARCKVRMDMNGSNYETWLKWQKRHHAAARDAEIAAAKYEAITKDGPSAWRQLSPEQRLALRAKVGQTADFTTSTSPQTLADVINDYADQAEGKKPFLSPDLANHLVDAVNPDPSIDSPAWAEKRARAQAKHTAAAVPAPPQGTGAPKSSTSGLAAPTPPPAPGAPRADRSNSTSTTQSSPTPPTQDSSTDAATRKPRQQTPRGYAGQRAARRRRLVAGQQIWSATKRGQRQLSNNQLTQFTRPDPEQSKNSEVSAMTDPTGLSLLLEMLKPSR